MFGRKKNAPMQAGYDDFDDFSDFGDAASMNGATGLIPGNQGDENAEEFYDDIFDFLPKGTPPTEKYR